MPHKLWRHLCCGRDILDGSHRCWSCRVDGAFAGWHLSMWEAMSRYARVYGLNPIGPHRRLANAWLTSRHSQCSRCGGHGLLTLSEEQYQDCPECDGDGGSWTCSAEEIDAVRQQIIARWPEAAIRRPSLSDPAQSGRSNAMRDAPLEEYKAHLWRRLAECQRREDRRIIAHHLERLSIEGRAALKSSLEGE
jgi:hypothetical protein